MTPTRSQVENWDVQHLTEAASHWTKTATVWEDHFSWYADQVRNPGGTRWEGEAAEAAQQQAHSDRLIVVALADQLHDASKIARVGALQLAEAQRLVMRTVTAAHDAGFTVGEDFSVMDHHVYSPAVGALRQAEAEGFAADLRALVADLVATDQRVATEITTASAGLGVDPFAGSDSNAGSQAQPENETGGGGGGGRFKTALFGRDLLKDLPPLADEPADPATESQGKTGNDLLGATGDATAGSSKVVATDAIKENKWYDLGRPQPDTGAAAAKAALAEKATMAQTIGKTGKILSAVSIAVDINEAVDGYSAQRAGGDAAVTALTDQGSKLGLKLGAGWVGAETGAAMGAALGSFVPGAGTVIGAGVGAAIGGLVGSDMGQAAGEAMSQGIHSFAAAESLADKALIVPATAANMIAAAGSKAAQDISGAAKQVWRFFAD